MEDFRIRETIFITSSHPLIIGAFYNNDKNISFIDLKQQTNRQ